MFGIYRILPIVAKASVVQGAISVLISLIQKGKRRFVPHKGLRDFQMTTLAGIVKRSIVSSVLGRDTGSPVNQQFYNLFVAISRRPVQGSEPVIIDL